MADRMPRGKSRIPAEAEMQPQAELLEARGDAERAWRATWRGG